MLRPKPDALRVCAALMESPTGECGSGMLCAAIGWRWSALNGAKMSRLLTDMVEAGMIKESGGRFSLVPFTCEVA